MQAFAAFFHALGFGGWVTKAMARLVATGTLALISTWLLVLSINTGYWMLTALTTQIIVMMYILVFAAAIRLRYTQPDTVRSYAIPGDRAGIWIVGGLGLAGCTFGLLIGFIPPAGVKHWASPVYIAAMAARIIV
jgi:amino acid transporter